MSDEFRVPRHAIRFLGTAAKLAAKHGLKKGLAKAAADTNPVLIVLETATSVLEAVDSFHKLQQARAQRQGLRELTRREAEALRLERAKLAEEIDLAKAELARYGQIQKRLGSLMLACSCALSQVWNELQTNRSADLPDIVAFEHRLDQLFTVWQQLQRAQFLYNEAGSSWQPGDSYGAAQDQAAGGETLGDL